METLQLLNRWSHCLKLSKYRGRQSSFLKMSGRYFAGYKNYKCEYFCVYLRQIDLNCVIFWSTGRSIGKLKNSTKNTQNEMHNEHITLLFGFECSSESN